MGENDLDESDMAAPVHIIITNGIMVYVPGEVRTLFSVELLETMERIKCMGVADRQTRQTDTGSSVTYTHSMGWGFAPSGSL